MVRLAEETEERKGEIVLSRCNFVCKEARRPLPLPFPTHPVDPTLPLPPPRPSNRSHPLPTRPTHHPPSHLLNQQPPHRSHTHFSLCSNKPAHPRPELQPTHRVNPLSHCYIRSAYFSCAEPFLQEYIRSASSGNGYDC
jgi:hypothetical protein